MLAHSQGNFCRVVYFGISNTALAVGLSRVPQKTTKTTFHIIRYHMACFLAARTRKKKRKKPLLRLVRARTAVKILLRCRTGKIKSNPLEPHFQNNVAVLKSARKLLSLCRTVVKARKSPSPGGAFWDQTCS